MLRLTVSPSVRLIGLSRKSALSDLTQVSDLGQMSGRCAPLHNRYIEILTLIFTKGMVGPMTISDADYGDYAEDMYDPDGPADDERDFEAEDYSWYWSEVEQGMYDDDPSPYAGDYSEM